MGEGAYPAAVELDGRSVLLVVGDEGACDSGYDGAGRDVSQAGAQLQRLPLSGAGGQCARRDLVAGEDDRGSHGECGLCCSTGR